MSRKRRPTQQDREVRAPVGPVAENLAYRQRPDRAILEAWRITLILDGLAVSWWTSPPLAAAYPCVDFRPKRRHLGGLPNKSSGMLPQKPQRRLMSTSRLARNCDPFALAKPIDDFARFC
jgi:hypothetical protein